MMIDWVEESSNVDYDPGIMAQSSNNNIIIRQKQYN